jgi:hypothetical protein
VGKGEAGFSFADERAIPDFSEDGFASQTDKFLRQVDMEAQTATKNNLKHEEIAAKAYQIWEAAGQPQGCELKHWLQAERELSAGQAKVSPVTAKPVQKPAAPNFQRPATEPAKPEPSRPGTSVRDTSPGPRRSAVEA